MNPILQSGTIYIVDDDESFLRSVARLLQACGCTVQTFASAEKFLEQHSLERSGCVLTDLDMPGQNGLELQAALAKSANPLPVVFLSAQGDIPVTVQAMRHGAEDFLTKFSPREQILEAVSRALTRGAQDRRTRERLQTLHARFAALTAREMEVLEQVVRGMMNKQIADELGINERTVKLHRTNLTRKLQVSSVAELTRLAEEAGLFQRGRVE